MSLKKIKPDKISKCKVAGCVNRGKIRKSGSESFVLGYCSIHYDRFRKYGDHNICKKESGNKKCKIAGCTNIPVISNGRVVFPKGFCALHYRRFRLYGDPFYRELIKGENRGEHPLYMTYHSMKDRCQNPNAIQYKDYGGRGILVCRRWLGLRGFDKFCLDMGDKPSKRHSIDRINVNGNYEPKNCRWAISKTQNRNKRNNKRVTYNGEDWLVIDLVEKLNLNYGLVRSRLQKGWPIEDAINKPILKKKRHFVNLNGKKISIYKASVLFKISCSTLRDRIIRMGLTLEQAVNLNKK